MNNEQLIRDLAAQLGTTTEYLWSVLVAHARVEGMLGLAWAAAFFALGSAAIVGARRVYNGKDPELAIVPGFLGALLMGIGCAMASLAITALASPEYWALKQVLEAIK